MRVSARVLSLTLFSLLMLPAAGEAAADSSGHYALSAWTPEKGLPPGDVRAITQDLEGYLWIGTTAGLVRFDGWQFVTWGTRGEPPLPGNAVSAPVGSHDGSLWISFSNASGVSRIRDGKLVNYSERDGLPAGPVAALLEDRHGVLLAGGRGGLARLSGNRWEAIASDDGFTRTDVYSLYEDHAGSVWVGAGSGVYRGQNDTFTLVYESAKVGWSLA